MLAISIIALVISGSALPFTVWAARAAAKQAEAARVQARAAESQTALQREQVAAAREQTELQRQLAQESSQPYVWADIQPDMQQGTVLHVVVGNSGPTMAEHIRVTFDPPLPAAPQQSDRVDHVQKILASGLRSLAPGRILRWTLGAGYELLASEDSKVRTVRVDASGPHGAVPATEIEIDISQWRQARDAPDGSLHHVRGAIKDLTKVVGSVDRTLKQAALRSQASEQPESIELDEFDAPFTRRRQIVSQQDAD
ncbi:hypothetical protein KZX45_08240 [Georgenia sp. EYE_87]|uniref:hypothetical protein n=1 Tax=Georgenia sp. EYE_87 TaxID=2853448 RepID=UPI00200422D4|nr:hypothetical protein [Georgenia sp. EYE_87]MCK6210530.1 hypothetical protein [Georgenia sp. EYE_87]